MEKYSKAHTLMLFLFLLNFKKVHDNESSIFDSYPTLFTVSKCGTYLLSLDGSLCEYPFLLNDLMGKGYLPVSKVCDGWSEWNNEYLQ